MTNRSRAQISSAPSGASAPPPTKTVEGAVDDALEQTLVQIRASDAAQSTRVSIDLGADKYTVTPATLLCDWADFDKRELAAPPKLYYDGRAGGQLDVMDRLRRRSAALQAEREAMARSFADEE